MISNILYGKNSYNTLEDGKVIVLWLKDMSLISLIRNWIKAKKIPKSKLVRKVK